MKWVMRFLMLLSFAPLTCYGFIYEIKILRKQRADGFHYFIGLSDFHDKVHPITKQQLNKIEHLLAQCDKNETKILLEDLSSRGSGGRSSCGRFTVNSRGGILGGLTRFCEERQLLVENVEYRYCRVSSLGPVLNNTYAHISQIPSVNDISIAELVQEIKDIVQEIKLYEDGPALTAYYKKNIQEVMDELKKLNMDARNQTSVGHYLALYSHQKNRLDVLKRLLTFDSSLLDLKMIHGVVASNKEKAVSIAGGSHITRVADALQKYMGYEVVCATPVEYSRENDVKKCLGSAIIDDNFCVRPQPIDLSILDMYI